jgi:hypothetical protein
MTIANREELEDLMAAFLQRLDGDDDYDAQVPNLIKLFEATIRPKFRSRILKGRTAITAFADPIVVPADFRAPIALLTFDSTNTLRGELPYRTARQQINDELDGGDPAGWTLEGSNIYIRAYPSTPADWKYRLHYYAFPTLGAAAGDTNVLLTNYPNLYLYGSLLQTAPYLYHDDRIPTWQKFFEDALEEVNAANDDEEFGTMQISMPAEAV